MRMIKRPKESTRSAKWHIRIVVSLLAASFTLTIFLWIGGIMQFLSSSNNINIFNKKDAAMVRRGAAQTRDTTTTSDTNDTNNHQHILSLNLDNLSPPITIRIAVFKEECPKAYEFVSFMVKNQATECNPCTIYRGEPVPSYWGSKDYPDRYFDGGRWGPPYALVQGGLVNSKFNKVQQDKNRPKVLQRGMVAWAGGSSTHFFIALAEHPEWGDFHTVWGYVLPEDMPLVDALVNERPLKVLKEQNPVVTNFVEPIHFQLAWEEGV